MEPADNVPGNELGWSCSVAPAARDTSVSRACCESPLKLHTIVPTFDKRTNNDNNHSGSNDSAVEISNWQANFPAVCQGVANSVSYIMEQEFYCFRKFQHISLLIWSSPPPLSSQLTARCSAHLPPFWPWPAPVKDCHAGIHMSVSVSYPLNCWLLHHIHLHSNASIHTHTHSWQLQGRQVD